MKTVLDVENTVTKRDGKLHLDPFEIDNKLVMVGILDEFGNEELIRFDDYVFGRGDVYLKTKIQDILDKTTLLIGHNIAHDLMWIWECGWKYDGKVFDTMLGSYVLQKGNKKPLSLEMCAERFKLNTQKQDTLKEYFKNGYGVDEIPKEELSKYLSADLHATQELYNELNKQINTEDNIGLVNTIDLTNDVSLTLARIYQRGFSVNTFTLDLVRKEFTKEKSDIEKYLNEKVRYFMGDTPINLNSPEQLSWLIYSRKPNDKHEWIDMMPTDSYSDGVKKYSSILYKTRAKQCTACKGYGKERKTRKDGKPFARETKCSSCNGLGYLFTQTNEIAGMKFKAPDYKWVTANGWSTSKVHLNLLAIIAKAKGMTDAEEFLNKVIRLSALDTYISSFVDGISHNIKSDNKLHVRLLQHRTATGR